MLTLVMRWGRRLKAKVGAVTVRRSFCEVTMCPDTQCAHNRSVDKVSALRGSIDTQESIIQCSYSSMFM